MKEQLKSILEKYKQSGWIQPKKLDELLDELVEFNKNYHKKQMEKIEYKVGYALGYTTGQANVMISRAFKDEEEQSGE